MLPGLWAGVVGWFALQLAEMSHAGLDSAGSLSGVVDWFASQHAEAFHAGLIQRAANSEAGSTLHKATMLMGMFCACVLLGTAGVEAKPLLGSEDSANSNAFDCWAHTTGCHRQHG